VKERVSVRDHLVAVIAKTTPASQHHRPLGGTPSNVVSATNAIEPNGGVLIAASCPAFVLALLPVDPPEVHPLLLVVLQHHVLQVQQVVLVDDAEGNGGPGRGVQAHRLRQLCVHFLGLTNAIVVVNVRCDNQPRRGKVTCTRKERSQKEILFAMKGNERVGERESTEQFLGVLEEAFVECVPTPPLSHKPL
jgi:hypothetical protein